MSLWLPVVAGSSRDLGGAMVDVVGLVRRIEELLVQGVEVEPLVGCSAERAVVEVEGIDVDPRAHGSRYAQGQKQTPLSGRRASVPKHRGGFAE